MKESGGVGRKVPKVSTSSSVGGDRELVEGDEEGEGEEEGERDEEEEEGGGREGETGKWVQVKKEWKEKHHKIGKRSPPPLIKRPLSPISRYSIVNVFCQKRLLLAQVYLVPT